MFSIVQICICLWLLAANNVFKVLAVTGPTHGKVVVCYIGTWAVYRPELGSFNLDNVDPVLCTHLVYSFAGLDIEQNSIKSLDPWQDLTENYGKGGYKKITSFKDNYPHLRVTLAIGGWNEGSSNYSMMARDPDRRKQFVSNALKFIRQHNFDGLDLDWEFPGKRGGNPDDKIHFLQLVKELRHEFDKHNLLLTAALGAGTDTIDIAYNVPQLSKYLDFMHLMCYDYHGSWDNTTNANAPLFSRQNELSVKNSVDYLLEMGADRSKIVMGVPFYGRTFYTLTEGAQHLGEPSQSVSFSGPYTRENGFMGYNEICMEMKNSSADGKWSKYWDDVSRTPFLVQGRKVISYDDGKSIGEKVRFAVKRHLAGIMVWSIDTDDFRGDCEHTVSDSAIFERFPLLRTINSAISREIHNVATNDLNESDNNGVVNMEPVQHCISSNLLFCLLFISVLFTEFYY